MVPGIPKRIEIADPGAGNMFEYQVLDNMRFMPQTLSFHFKVANTAPDRTVGIQYAFGVDIYYQSYSESTLDDAEEADFTFDIAGHMHYAAGPEHISVPLADIILLNDMTIQSVVDNVNAADLFTDIFLYGQFWLTPH